MRDPRLPPVTADDWPELDVKVSVLDRPADCPAASRDELLAACAPGVDGLILIDGRSRATFLPAVWAKLPEPRAVPRRTAGQGRLSGWPDGPGRAGDTAPRSSGTAHRGRARDLMLVMCGGTLVEEAGQEGRRRLARGARRRPRLPGVDRLARRRALVVSGPDEQAAPGLAGRAPPRSACAATTAGGSSLDRDGRVPVDPRRGVDGARAAAGRQAAQRRHRPTRTGGRPMRGQPAHPGRRRAAGAVARGLAGRAARPSPATRLPKRPFRLHRVRNARR